MKINKKSTKHETEKHIKLNTMKNVKPIKSTNHETHYKKSTKTIKQKKKTINGSYGPMVTTADFESANLGSIPSKTSISEHSSVGRALDCSS